MYNSAYAYYNYLPSQCIYGLFYVCSEMLIVLHVILVCWDIMIFVFSAKKVIDVLNRFMLLLYNYIVC